MPRGPEEHYAEFREDEGKTLLARIELPNGNNATQAAVTGITYSVFADGVAVGVEDTALVVADTIFDALQGANDTDKRWTKDKTGYNFRFEVPAARFPAPAEECRVEILFDPTSGENFHVVWKGPVKGVLGS